MRGDGNPLGLTHDDRHDCNIHTNVAEKYAPGIVNVQLSEVSHQVIIYLTLYMYECPCLAWSCIPISNHKQRNLGCECCLCIVYWVASKGWAH
jgi:hypothetical protein